MHWRAGRRHTPSLIPIIWREHAFCTLHDGTPRNASGLCRLNKILERSNLRNHEQTLLRRFFSEPIVEFVMEILSEKKNMIEKFKESKEFIRSVPIVAFNPTPNKFTPTL